MNDPRLTLLGEMVDKLGLQAVADEIDRSKSAVCHVHRGTYKGNPEAILRAVEEKFSQRLVECPVLGEIPLNRCVEERNRPFAATNPVRVRLARMCKGCGRNTKGGE